MMVSFGKKTKIKQAGNLNEGRSYVITTVTIHCFLKEEKKKFEIGILSRRVLIGHFT